mgnify:CR=1 FL=1
MAMAIHNPNLGGLWQRERERENVHDCLPFVKHWVLRGTWVKNGDGWWNESYE